MSRFRKKPVEVEAWLFAPGSTAADFPAWLEPRGVFFRPGAVSGPLHVIHIKTLEGTMTASEGDWIIQGTKGEVYPCKPDIFAEIYEPA